MTPADLLSAATSLIGRPDAATAGVWPRTAALLTRQALEQAVQDRWRAQPDTAGLSSRSRRTQLICLRWYIDPEIAEQVRYTWAALSSACHYHPYELAPTAVELARWISDVTRLITHLAAGADHASSETAAKAAHG